MFWWFWFAQFSLNIMKVSKFYFRAPDRSDVSICHVGCQRQVKDGATSTR